MLHIDTCSYDEVTLSEDQLQELAEIFRLLGEPNRLSLVVRCLGGPQGVGELTAATGLTQSLVSHHLRLLRAARILRANRRGKQVFYAIADGHVQQTLVNMIEHMTEPHQHEPHDHEADGNEGADP